MAVKVSRDEGNPGDEAEGLQTIFVHRIVVRFRIKTAERGDGRANGVHGRRVCGKSLDDVDDAFRQVPFRSEQAFQFVQFLAVGQMVVMQEVHHFFKSHLAGQFVDVVAAINQLADVAPDIVQPGGGGNNAFQTFCGSWYGSHGLFRRCPGSPGFGIFFRRQI